MARKIQNIIGHRLARARAGHYPRITQLALSEKETKIGTPIDRAGIAKIENGMRGVLDYELLALSRALVVDPVWLLTGRKAKKQS